MDFVRVIYFSYQYRLLLLNSFGVTVNSISIIQFSFQYILLLFNSFGVKFNSMPVIQFSSQYRLLLLNSFDVTLSFVTVIQFSSQYILLLLYSFGVTLYSVTVVHLVLNMKFYFHGCNKYRFSNRCASTICLCTFPEITFLSFKSQLTLYDHHLKLIIIASFFFTYYAIQFLRSHTA